MRRTLVLVPLALAVVVKLALMAVEITLGTLVPSRRTP